MLCQTCRGVTPRRCVSCGQRRRPVVRWSDGPRCHSCYQAALHAKATCPRCGTFRRLLPHRGVEEPICAPCAEADPGPVCGECGNEDWLYEKGRCTRCTLAWRLAALLGDANQRQARGLEPVFTALVEAEAPYSVIGWLRRGPAAVLLTQLGTGQVALSHAALETLAPSRTVRHLQGLLVATGVLPARDRYLAQLERWVTDSAGAVADPAHQRLVHRYATWKELRHARAAAERGPLSWSAYCASRHRLRAAAAFLDWLGERGRELDHCRQADIDEWLEEGSALHRDARSFVVWAMSRNLAPRVEFPLPPKTAVGQPVGDDERWEIARRLLHGENITAADRVAGCLVVLFGQRLSRISTMTVDDIVHDGDDLALCLGPTPIRLAEPLATHVRDVLAARRPPLAARVDPGPWLFPGNTPGHPLSPLKLGRRLRAAGVDTSGSRRRALVQLCGDVPAAVIADLLGVNVSTAIKWARLAGRPWGDYVALRVGQTRQP